MSGESEEYEERGAKLRAATRWVEAQPVRQRVLLLVAVAAVSFTLWDAVLMRSLTVREEQAEADTELLEKQVKALELEAEATVKKLAADPNLERRKRKAELQRQLADLDARFHERTADLIPPTEMVRVLKELLGRETKLQLVRLESLVAMPLLSPEDEESETGSDSATAQVRVFRHGLVIEMLGDYLSALHYLQAVEELPWKFFWESLNYEVQEWPVGRITLKVLSLSTEEGWIGV